MAINLNKGPKLGQYFYIENGVEYGPIELSDLLTKINKDTLIFYNGISWTKASETDDLKKYFIQVVEDSTHSKHSNSVKRGKSGFGIYLFGLLFFLLIGAWWFISNHNQKQREEKYLSDLNEVREKYIRDSMDIEHRKIENSIQLDSISIAINSKLDSIRFNENISEFVDESPIILDLMKNYYQDIENNQMNANTYFSENVDRFINARNTNPDKINDYFKRFKDYSNSSALINDTSFHFQSLSNGIKYYQYTVSLTIFRPRRNQFQYCDVDIEIGIDSSNKIKKYIEKQVKNLKYE